MKLIWARLAVDKDKPHVAGKLISVSYCSLHRWVTVVPVVFI